MMLAKIVGLNWIVPDQVENVIERKRKMLFWNLVLETVCLVAFCLLFLFSNGAILFERATFFFGIMSVWWLVMTAIDWVEYRYWCLVKRINEVTA